MTTEKDRPHVQPNRRVSGRGWVAVAIIGVVLFLTLGRALASFFVEQQWFASLGRGDVFWGQIRAKVGLFVVFGAIFIALAWVNLWYADRTAPATFSANVHPVVERFHEIFGQRLRVVRYAIVLPLALLFAMSASAMWVQWLQFRHGTTFGVTDAQFHRDVGFYVFQLPFVSFIIDWVFAALLLVLVLSAFAHFLNGGVLFASTIPTVRSSTKNHLAVLLATLAVVKGADYWFTRYELTTSRRGFVDGATYSVVHAQLPAMLLLALIAITTAGLYLSTVRTNRWRLPLLASALWLIVSVLGGVAYPNVVESLVVRPNQEAREAPYIARNVSATRDAFGLNDVTKEGVEFGQLTAAEVEGDLEPIRNVRLLNPTQMLDRFAIDRGEVAGLQIADLDVDRYAIDGKTEQVLIAARELDQAGIPNRSWPGAHLISTRGCGLVMAPVGKVTDNDRPVYSSPELTRPQLYFSQQIDGYSIVGTSVDESPCGQAGPYTGTTGIKMGGFVKRATIAWAFLDYNIIGTGAISDDSQMLWVRSVSERVRKLAPFLEFDSDPYPVIVDGGISWVLDAYTSTDRYPYSQAIGDVQLTNRSDVSRNANYLRNSVKAVVDAYTGDTKFYVMDVNDPILKTWQSVFPNLFTARDQMPDELTQHLRYPEDLFRVQTELYSKYQIDAADFFQRRGAWSVAQAPSVDRQEQLTTGSATTGTLPNDRTQVFATESNVQRFVPYYTMFSMGPGDDEEFVMFRPFVPFSNNDARTELQAYMTVSSDFADYGKLTAYTVTNDPRIIGPYRVADQAESEPDISETLSLQYDTNTGTRVRFGDMQLIPVADGLLYIRPVYVISSEFTEYRFVIVSHNSKSAMAENLDAALAQVFKGYTGVVGEQVSESGVPVDPAADPETPPTPSEPSTEPPSGEVAQLLDEASKTYDEAQTDLANGDLGAYQEKMDKVGELVKQAAEAIANGSG